MSDIDKEKLFQEIKKGNLVTVKEIWSDEYFDKVNKYGKTALYLALEYNKQQTFKFLLDKYKNKNLDKKNIYDWGYLHIAVKKKNYEFSRTRSFRFRRININSSRFVTFINF